MIKEFKGEYRWLSNFEPVLVRYEGVNYPSVEHAYMSAKNDDVFWKLKCSSGDFSPGEIKKLSRDINLVENWDDIKLDVMKICLEQKFKQEPFKTKLINTGDSHIQEGNWWNDKFWGVCLKTGKGENHLGKMIMEIRDVLVLESFIESKMSQIDSKELFVKHFITGQTILHIDKEGNIKKL